MGRRPAVGNSASLPSVGAGDFDILGRRYDERRAGRGDFRGGSIRDSQGYIEHR